MRFTDIAIVGGGLAGSTIAATLGRAGIPAILIDPHPVYPPDLRCEKLGGGQVDILRKTGLAEPTVRATTLDGHVWIARFGYLVQKRASDQYGIMYDTLVNTIRAEITSPVDVIVDKVTAVSTSADRQQIVLASGEEISARLIVLANGPSVSLRHTLGIEREITSACHSITIGFDIAPADRAAFEFPALTYYPERASDRMAYLTSWISISNQRNLRYSRLSVISTPWPT